MKKIFRLLITVLIVLTLCSCKEKKEYPIEELSAREIVSNYRENKSFIFAFLKDNDDQSKQLLESLQKAANTTKQTLYYAYLEHIDGDSSLILYSILEENYNYNYIVKITEGKRNGFVYTNYQKLYENIYKFKSDDEIIRTDEQTIKKTIKEAHSFYEKGKLGSANNKLNEVYSSKQAKKEIESNNYYKIVNSWDTYTTGSKENTFVYHNMIFSLFNNTIKLYEQEGKMEDIKIPATINKEYTTYYYYIKNGIIYTSKVENGKYKKRYKINELNNEVLNITDLNNKLNMNLLRRE